MRTAGVLMAILVGTLRAQERAVAQVPAPARLTDPHTVVMATRTVQAGAFELDSFRMVDFTGKEGPAFSGYVPQQCLGTRRCPLLVVNLGYIMELLRPALDRYGIIALITHYGSDVDALQAYRDQGRRDPGLERLDAALKQVYQRFAIDPDKIALMGRCGSVPGAAFLGRDNLNIFSRIILNSGTTGYAPLLLAVSPQLKTTKVLLIAGLKEASLGMQNAAYAQALRREGLTVKEVLGFRGHEGQWEDYSFVVRWLYESWATLDPAARPASQVIVEPLPLLTTKALAQMTAFWIRFMQEHDSIKVAARRAHLREVSLPLWGTSPSIVMTDMSALSVKYPSVAADLREASRLEPRQHESYRVALASAQYIVEVQDIMETLLRREQRGDLQTEALRRQLHPGLPQMVANGLATNPTLRKNVEFLRAHLDELRALEVTRMWYTP